jgi:hypothetical protein
VIANGSGGSLGHRDTPVDQTPEVTLKGAPMDAGDEGLELLDPGWPRSKSQGRTLPVSRRLTEH